MVAKPAHSMIRVCDEQRSLDFYDKAFSLKLAERFELRRFCVALSAQRQSLRSSWS